MIKNYFKIAKVFIYFEIELVNTNSIERTSNVLIHNIQILKYIFFVYYCEYYIICNFYHTKL